MPVGGAFGSRTSSTAEKYRGSRVKWNYCSWLRRTRSVTDSGSPFGFDQITSARGRAEVTVRPP